MQHPPSRVVFNKASQSPNKEHIELLKSRGLKFEDETAASGYFNRIGYNRLGGYVKNFQNSEGRFIEESIGNAHDFWITYAHSGFERQQPPPLAIFSWANTNPTRTELQLELHNLTLLACHHLENLGVIKQRGLRGLRMPSATKYS